MPLVAEESSLVAKINQWNFDGVKLQLRRREKLADDLIDRMLTEYKRYLCIALSAVGDTIFPLSQEVDGVWHWHILLTDDYKKFCEHLLGSGRFIHHIIPTDDEMLARAQFYYEKNTRPAYVKMFAEEPPEDLWKMAICWCCKDIVG